MNVAWKFVAVLAMLFSLAALTIQIVQIQSEDTETLIRLEIQVALQAREEKILRQLGPAVEDLRDHRHLPAKAIKSIEDLGDSIVEVVYSIPATRPEPVARP